jgi:uncharacterized protein (TIGR02444 family)
MARNPFWAFSLRIYRRPGVAPACLALQDRADVDVNLLLFCLWAGREGLTLQGASLAKALSLSREWAAIIQPLRQSRRVLKPKADRDAQSLRGDVLKLELEAERLIQRSLYALRLPRATDEGVVLAADNVGRYFRAAGIRLTQSGWSALQVVVRAAFGI